MIYIMMAEIYCQIALVAIGYFSMCTLLHNSVSVTDADDCCQVHYYCFCYDNNSGLCQQNN